MDRRLKLVALLLPELALLAVAVPLLFTSRRWLGIAIISVLVVAWAVGLAAMFAARRDLAKGRYRRPFGL
jgi:hypothetical protein